MTDSKTFAALWAASCAADIAQIRSAAPKDRAMIAKGLVDGICRATVPYPGQLGGPDIPGIRPCFDPGYELGYDTGERYAAAAAILAKKTAAETCGAVVPCPACGSATVQPTKAAATEEEVPAP